MRITIAMLALLGVSACGQGVAEDELQPGNWEINVGMTDIEVPGATAEQAAMFKDALGSTMSQEQCVSEGENKFDPETMSEAFKQGGDCTIDNFDLDGGVIDGKMSCKMPGDITNEMAITGSINSEAFSMSVATELAQEALPEGKAQVTIEVSGKRIGDC